MAAAPFINLILRLAVGENKSVKTAGKLTFLKAGNFG